MLSFNINSIIIKLVNRKWKNTPHHQWFSLLVIFILLIGAFTSVNAKVLQCQDHSGNTIFTDNASLCAIANDISNNVITEIATKRHCGKKVVNKHKVDYCSPRRDYYKKGSNWTIYLEQRLVDEDKALADNSLKKLEKNLNEIINLLPANPARELKKLDVYLMKGEKSPIGEGGMSYIRPGEANNYHYLDPRWQHVIVVYSAKTLMYLDEVWTKKALMHELAHAWHISKWPQRHPPIYNAYLNAKDKGLYCEIVDYKGRKIETAYALKNQMEYFADLSSMYFVGGNYFPYSRKGLKKYDITGYEVVKYLWGEK